ncbi:LuxR C-terminal-related transcriptional regulator [Reichenbachiella sp.]|uniref:LuxR C-terminal-related transcriptional regulator n=1 Tax=Reichenbachiella sp. TaxID=2184521 RepID=UPI003BB01630
MCAQSPIEEAYEKEDYKTVIHLADSILQTPTELEVALLHQMKADAWYYLGELEPSLEGYFKAIHAGENAEVRNDLLLLECYSHAGFCYREMGLFQKALPHYKHSLSIAKSIKDSVECAQQFYNLGSIYQHLGNYERATELLDSAYQIDLALKDTVALGFDLAFLSELKMQLNDLDNALYYAKESLLLLPPGGGNANSHANRVKQVGSVLLAMQELDSADYYLSLAENEYLEINDQWRLASCWLEQAKLKMLQGQYSDAVNLALNANSFYSQKRESQFLIHSNNILAQAYGELLMVDKALEILKDNQKKCENFGDIKMLRDNFRLQSELYVKMDNQPAADLLNEQFESLQDSINEFTNREQLNRLALQIKFDKLEQENQILSDRYEANAIDLVDKTNRLNYLTIGGVLVFIILCGIIYLIRVKFRKRNEELQGEVAELRHQIKLLLEGDTSELTADLTKINECLTTPLTDREFEILGYAIGDLNNSQIAEKIFVSVNTVKYHLKNIYEKLGVSNRKQALEYIVKAN